MGIVDSPPGASRQARKVPPVGFVSVCVWKIDRNLPQAAAAKPSFPVTRNSISLRTTVAPPVDRIGSAEGWIRNTAYGSEIAEPSGGCLCRFHRIPPGHSAAKEPLTPQAV